MSTTKKELDVRCVKCNKLVAIDKQNRLEVKCVRCGSINDIFNDSSELTIITDETGRVIYMNNLAQKITEYDLSEAIGKRPTELWSKLVPPEQFKKIDAKVKSGESGYSEIIPLITKTGGIFNISLTVSPIRNSQESILFFVGIGKLVDE